MVAVAYERWSLTILQQVPNIYSDLTFLENWSLRSGGRNRRFDLIKSMKILSMLFPCIKFCIQFSAADYEGFFLTDKCMEY